MQKEPKLQSLDDDETADSPGLGGSSGSATRKSRSAEYRESGWYTDDGKGSWGWQPQVLKLPEGPVNRQRRDSSLCDDRCKEDMYAGFDFEEWLEMAESGELDIYSCLGLSDANTLTGNTKKLIAKIVGVLVLQLMVPVVMLSLQIEGGITFRPRVPDPGYRIIGFSLYLYSLYSMYNNALDECRYRLLKFALDNKLASGYWWPLVVGEFSNTTVSLVLVFCLFFIYTNSRRAMDLILNAVAVNFLGAVDAEMVDSEMMRDGIGSFKELMNQFRKEGSHEMKTDTLVGKITDWVLNVMLFSIVSSGIILAFLFLLLESPAGSNEQAGRTSTTTTT